MLAVPAAALPDAPRGAASGPTRAEKRHARESAARREERRYNRLYDRQERRYGSSASAPPRRKWGDTAAAAAAATLSTRVLVSSLPNDADRDEELELELRRAFFDCGRVREVHWPSRRQWQLGVRHCVLEFVDEAAAAKAVRNSRHTNQRLLGGVPLEVSLEEPDKLTR